MSVIHRSITHNNNVPLRASIPTVIGGSLSLTDQYGVPIWFVEKLFKVLSVSEKNIRYRYHTGMDNDRGKTFEFVVLTREDDEEKELVIGPDSTLTYKELHDLLS